MEATQQCEGQVVGGFPLRHCLAKGDNSLVYETQREGGQKAAIKFVAAAGDVAKKQLSTWDRAAKLSHPHLLRIFETGQSQLAGRDYVYVVMEFAEENLAEILPQRALTPLETTDMLGPLLESLGYLHRNGFIHGHLRPSNILAVSNQLKLSSDSVRAIGEGYQKRTLQSAYEAPEVGSAPVSPSADVWSLGMTLVEVLTQRVSRLERADSNEPLVPESVPQPFRDIARNCLKQNPAERWTVEQIAAKLSSSTPPPQVVPTPRRQALNGALIPKIGVGALVIAVAILALILFRRSGNSNTGTSSQPPAAASSRPAAVPKPAPGRVNGSQINPQTNGTGETAAPTTGNGDIVHEALPNVAPSAQRTITGHLKVRIRVHVDQAGNVTGAEFVTHGPSVYFARISMEAARQWKFVSANAAARAWILQFSFSRKETTVHAAKATS